MVEGSSVAGSVDVVVTSVVDSVDVVVVEVDDVAADSSFEASRVD